MDGRDLNRELCKLAKELDTVTPSVVKIKVLSDIRELLSSSDKKVTDHSVAKLTDAVRPLCSSPSPMVARLSCSVISRLATASSILSDLLSKPYSSLEKRDVQLLHCLILSDVVTEFPLSSFLAQLTSFKQCIKQSSYINPVSECYAAMVVDALQQLGACWTAAVSTVLHKSFILPLLTFPTMSHLIADLLLSLPGICLVPKLLADLFDNPATDLGVLAAALKGAESCGLSTAKVNCREIPAWLSRILRRALAAILTGSPECAGAAQLVGVMADAGWLTMLTMDEQRQLAGTCVAAIQNCVSLPMSTRQAITLKFQLTVKQGRKINLEYSEAVAEPEVKKRKIERNNCTIVKTAGVSFSFQPDVVLPIPVDTD